MKDLIIQESRGWSGQNHELHRLQQTTIKGEESALSKTTLSSQKTTFSQTETPSQKTRRRKRSIFCHTKTFFAKLHENSQVPMTYTTLLILPKDSQVTYSMIHVFKE